MSASRANSATDQASRFHKLSNNILLEIDNYNINRLKKLYSFLQFKEDIASRNLWFVNTCKREDLVPKFLFRFGIKKLRVNDQAKVKINRILLCNEQKRWYSAIANIRHYINYIRNKLVDVLSERELSCLNHNISQDINSSGEKKRLIMNKKLKVLRKQNIIIQNNNNQNIVNVDNTQVTVDNNQLAPVSPPHNNLSLTSSFIISNESPTAQEVDNCITTPTAVCEHVFHKRTILLTDSSVTFNYKELQLLHYGLKYSPSYNQNNSLDIIKLGVTLDSFKLKSDINAELSVMLKNEINKGKHCARYKTAQQLSERATLMELKNKVITHNLTIVKADKGNATVVLPRSVYIDKVQSFLQLHNFSLLTEDPTLTIQQKVRCALKQNKALYSNNVRLLNMNPQAPRLYGAPKVHKQGMPIRPIVSCCGSPTEKVAKALNYDFKKITHFQAYDSIKNSTELINSIKAVNIRQDYILVSFDVVDLFTSIPPNVCLTLMRIILEKSSHDKILNAEVMELLSTCFEYNYAVFNGSIYSNPRGLAMGSPLSCLAAEVFMHYFAKEFVHDPNNPYRRYIVLWKRYVDDVFCVWRGSHAQLNGFLKYLNACYAGIQFTMEIEDSAGSLNYLDLTLTKFENNIQFSIYRKPTCTDTVLHATSRHPWSHKLAAFHSYTHRLVNTPLNKENFDKEKNILYHIARSNGYSVSIVDKLIEKKQRQLLINNIYPSGSVTHSSENVDRWCSIPYIGSVSTRVSNCLKKAGMRAAFRSVSTLRQELSKPKDIVQPIERSGVYLIKCGYLDCEKHYLGQTGRDFASRFREHLRGPSNFYKHISEAKHGKKGHQVSFLHFETKGAKLNSLENLAIKRALEKDGDNCLNDKSDGGGSAILQALVSSSRPPLVRLQSLDPLLRPS